MSNQRNNQNPTIFPTRDAAQAELAKRETELPTNTREWLSIYGSGHEWFIAYHDETGGLCSWA